MSDATPFAFPLTWRFKPQLDSSLGLNKEIRAIMHNTLWILVDTWPPMKKNTGSSVLHYLVLIIIREYKSH